MDTQRTAGNSSPADGTAARRFACRFLAVAFITLAGAAAVNLLVDPHGLYRLMDRAGFNEIKPRGDQAIELFKYRAIDFNHPRTLLVGNSRAEMGWDPESLKSSENSPAVNVSVPGTSLGDMNQIVEYAWRQARPRELFVGVDFFDCLTSGNRQAPSPPAIHPWASDARSLRVYADRAYLILGDLLSLDTTVDSLLTLIAQRRPDSPNLRRDGFRPARDYYRMVALEGARKMFVQREQETVRRRVNGPKSVRYDDGTPDACFEHLERLLQNGVRRGQTIHVGTYPYHARLLEIIAQIGLWPAYEDWKREVLRHVSAARESGGKASLRDFGAYHAYSVEPVPSAGRRDPVPRWYWESGHFKAELGSRMLRVMTGEEPPDGLFGVELTPGTIEATLAAIRKSRATYEHDQPAAVAEIREEIARAGKSR